jgi:hypothetical protein
MRIIQTFLFETDFFMNKKDINYHLFTKKIVRYGMHSIKNISERNKIDAQSRDDACIRKKRLISKSDYGII